MRDSERQGFWGRNGVSYGRETCGMRIDSVRCGSVSMAMGKQALAKCLWFDDREFY